MTDSKTLPVIGAAVTAPAWLPTVAAIAPQLLIGATIGLGLVWLFSDDKQRPAPATPDGATPPAPNPPPKQERGFWHSFWNDGWSFDDDAKPAAPSPAPVRSPMFTFGRDESTPATPSITEAERQQRIRDNKAKLARTQREIERLNASIAEKEARLEAARQDRERMAAAARPQLAAPRPTIPAAPISAPQPAVTP